ncbi:ABC transporter permease [Siccirubricoccus phaeus]|uniref:ABC transporter permease n=1 Tax=Siccirubricoccus phaeus TaxID=2595053 RepID=UPI0011F2FD8F|nr:ABC transporter permease [Siccirubricoccus phaeus]
MAEAERGSRGGRALLLAAAAPILLFLLLPSLIIVPMALTRGQLLQFPPEWVSVRPFLDYVGDGNWTASTLLSLQVALLATLVGAVCGTAAAVGLHGRRFTGRGLLIGLIMSPIVVPVVVLALGQYLVFARLQLLGSPLSIGLAHGLLATPYVFISVQTSLAANLDPALIRSARSLGARFPSVLRHVYWPAVRPGLGAGALLGFAVSFDEVVIALFLQGPQGVTLPVRMFTAIQFELTPKIAAAASVFIALAVLGLVVQALGRRGEVQP